MELAVVCPPSRQGLATLAQLKTAGVNRHAVAKAVRDAVLVRTHRGVYSPAALPEVATHLLSGGVIDKGYLAWVRSVLLSLGKDCMAARRTAAALWGFDMYIEPHDVEVAVPLDRGRTSLVGVLVLRRSRTAVSRHVLGFAPINLTSAVDTVIDCALGLSLTEAVVIADSALRAKAVTVAELRAATGDLRGTPGVGRVRRVLELCDPKSGSVLESLFRVLVVEAGLAQPTSQFVVRDRAVFIGRADFCWSALRLLVECDGRRWHDPDDVRTTDRRRDNAFERLSWRLLRFTWAEVVHDPEYVLSTVRQCLDGWMSAA